MLLYLLFLGSECCKFEKWSADNAQKMTLFRCWMIDEWVWRRYVPPVTSVEVNKHQIFDANNAWITELQIQKPKKHNLSNIPHQTVKKLQKTMGSSEGPSLVNNVDELSSKSAFAVGSRSAVNIFYRDGRSQDLPDIYCLLASVRWNPLGLIISILTLY